MADNFKNCSTKSVKAANSAKGSRHLTRRRRKRKHSTKRKNNYNYKRKHSFIIRKTKLQMNTSSAVVVPASFKGEQHEDDIAFWKARALSLEFENNMLHKHIKQIYKDMIPQNQQLVQNEDEEYFDDEGLEFEKKDLYKSNNNVNKENAEMEQDQEEEENSKPPEEQKSKKREEEIKMLYGSSWRTIIGMETAVQLNYDLIVERNKSKYWPVVPIKI